MTKFYVDLECDDLKGTTLLQLSAISENGDIFNGFCQIPLDRPIPDKITELTGFCCYKGDLYHNGTHCESHPRKYILKKFAKWLDLKTDGPPVLIAHNGFGYDWRVLHKHFHECELDINAYITYCDTLPTLKKYYKLHPTHSPENFTLGALAKLYQVESTSAHNALSDAITLKRICDYFIFDHKLESDFFTQVQKTHWDYIVEFRPEFAKFFKKPGNESKDKSATSGQ